jgi:glutamate-ammonia-ligase adenylyltransferase
MDAPALNEYLDRNCPRLSDIVSKIPSQVLEQVIDEILDTPNPKTTAVRIDDLLVEGSASTIVQIFQNQSARVPFLATVAGSGFLFSVICRNPSLLQPMFVQGGYLVRKERIVQECDLRIRTDGIQDTPQFDSVLRLYKEEEYLRIGCRDLAQLADVIEVMAELSDLACACTQASIEFHYPRLVLKHGTPNAPGDSMGFTVIGMGKVSGRELNFSSDVDLIYLRGPEEGLTTGPQVVTAKQFYESLAHQVTRSLSSVTEDGFVFRVDLRLRPEGEKGELVPSLNNALDYYLGWGRTWERAALMKAVPIAGDLDLGRTFVEELEPFVYRKHLDYSTLEEMRVMKLRIETKLKRKPGINIKLGQGGIREIEFFVQALQLINGGRIRRVRSPSTLEALRLLNETGLLDRRTSEDLEEAYLFFRKTEHRIQMNYQLQTHELPKTSEEQAELALRLGYKKTPLQSFLADLEKRRRSVEELFSSMFYHSGEEILQQVSPRAIKIVESIHDEALTRFLLEEHGFKDPAGSFTILKNLVHPSPKRIASDKGRDLLERLAPLFIEELLKVPEPDKTLIALDRYIDSLQAGSGYFSTFLENPPTVQFLVKILGESRFFTELLIRHPQSIDALIASGSHANPSEKVVLENELAERLAYCEDFESELDTLRRFKNEEMLLIGVRHLWGEIDSHNARRLISGLADACLGSAVEIAKKEMVHKYGFQDFPDPLPFVILGMGKLGGMEMTYLSDLDVIFIYDYPLDKIGRFFTHEWFTRLASRIISILSAPTSEGTAFSIDTRLRPSGNKGPLVSSLISFRDYHRITSKLWEKQALIKARPVIGPRVLADEVAAIIRDFLMRTVASDEDLKEIAYLRRRMEQELAMEDKLHVDLKTGHGGLVDVEFFVQGNILKSCGHRPEILCNNTLQAISALRDASLIDEESFNTLDSGYRFLTNLEDRLRLMEHRSVDRIPLVGDKLRGLALRLGYGNGGEESLINDYVRITESIRKIYSSFFGEKSKEICNN